MHLSGAFASIAEYAPSSKLLCSFYIVSLARLGASFLHERSRKIDKERDSERKAGEREGGNVMIENEERKSGRWEGGREGGGGGRKAFTLCS